MMYQKSYVVSKTLRYVKRSELQQKVLHQIRTLKWGTPCHSTASVFLEQPRNAYSLFVLKRKATAVLYLTKYNLQSTPRCKKSRN